MRFILFIALVGMIATACSKSDVTLLGSIEEVKKITLEKPSCMFGTSAGDGFFVYQDKRTNELRAIDEQGKIFWTYLKEGRGPGEFSTELRIAGLKNNILYIFDHALSKIALFNYDPAQRTFTFSDEYLLDNAALAELVVLDDGSFLCTQAIGKTELVSFDKNGKLTAEMIPMEEVDLSKFNATQIREYFQNMKVIRYSDGKNIIRTNPMKGIIYCGTLINNTYTEIAHFTPKYLPPEPKNDLKIQQEGKEELTIKLHAKSFTALNVHNNVFYVMITDQEQKNSLFCESYTLDGKMNGVYTMAVSENEKPYRLCFYGDTKVVYQKRTPDVKDDDEAVDETVFYIADFKNNKKL